MEFIIMIYDVNAKRTNTFLNIGRKFLQHEQNSVLMGSIDEARYIKLKNEVQKKLKDEDKVEFLKIKYVSNIEREQLSVDKEKTRKLIDDDDLFI